MLLRGKNAVITGCLQGIGRTTMDVFANNGANIFACCQYEDQEFIKHIQSLQAECNVKIVPVYFDLANEDQIKDAVKSIMANEKDIDILINNAGMVFNAIFHMTTIEKMKYVFDIDFFSQMLITQYISKLMVKRKRGSIINVSSVAALDGNAGQIAYSAAKAALIGATKTLAEELAEHKIRVNAIAPGVIDTNMTAELPTVKFQKLVGKIALGRAGTTTEVANLLLFLASDLSAYITGQVIRVDGGM